MADRAKGRNMTTRSIRLSSSGRNVVRSARSAARLAEARLGRSESDAGACRDRRADVRREDDHAPPEVDEASVGIGQAAVVEDRRKTSHTGSAAFSNSSSRRR
jgi:hypothetical protein